MNIQLSPQNRLGSLLLLAALSALCLMLPTGAQALNIETSTIDGSVDINPSAEFVTGTTTRKRTALMGRKQCKRVWENNNNLRISYQFTQQVSIGQCVGAMPCVERIMFFAVPIDSNPPDFSCDVDSTSSCVEVDETNLPEVKLENQSANGFDLRVRFRHLVDEVAGELDEESEIRQIQSADDCSLEDDESIDYQYFFRLFMKNLGVNSDQTEYSDAVIEIDTKRPTGPVEINSVAVTESSIYATWVQQDKRKLKDFRLYWSEEDFSGMEPREIEESSAVKSSVVQLDNPDPEGTTFSGKASTGKLPVGERIYVAISSRDTAENASPPTFPGEDLDPENDGFEVIKVIDFWEHYRSSGGSETGGCSVGARAPALPGGLALLGVAGLFVGLRRRRKAPKSSATSWGTFGKWLLLLIAPGVMFFAPAKAQAESPIYGMAELRFGLYYPNIDDEAGLSGTPFEDIFDTHNRLLFEYEMGVHLFKGFGALGLSGSLGYTNFGGDVIVEDAAPGEDSSSGTSEQTDFMFIPLALSAYYRFDVLEKKWRIPFVPVLKAGLNYTMWSVDGSGGKTASFQGDEARGGTFGWHAAAALHLWLDWIDPSSAASFDNTWGINNSYLFAEYSHREIDDFGSAESFNLSDDLWVFGIAFEY